MNRHEKEVAKVLDEMGIEYVFRYKGNERERSIYLWQKEAEIVIRKWLNKYNYLFSAPEITDLAEMLEEQLSKVDWADYVFYEEGK